MKRSVFCKRLKEARLEAKLTQEKLGVLAGIEESTANARMNHYEKGRNEPNFALVEIIAKVLRLPAAYFFAEDDEAKLLRHFHRMSEEGRKKLLAHAAELDSPAGRL